MTIKHNGGRMTKDKKLIDCCAVGDGSVVITIEAFECVVFGGDTGGWIGIVVELFVFEEWGSPQINCGTLV